MMRVETLVLLFLLAVALVHGASREITREEILASRERRGKQIESLLDDSKQRLSDHRSGVRILNDKERKDLEHKVTIYQRKLDTMKGELDEREIDRLLKREQLHQERLKERRERNREL